MRIIFCLLLACALPVMAAGPVTHWTPPTETGVGWDSGDYAYDDSGNIAKIGLDKFGYDGVNRLTGATVNAHNVATTQNFTYDGYGNLLNYSTFIVRGAAPPEIDGASFTISPQTNHLATTYDDAGNQTRHEDIVYRWDPTGALTEIEGSVAHERYVYDATNERVAMISLDGNREVIRRWTWRDQANKVAREAVEHVGSDRWTEARDYVYRSGALLASFETAGATVAERHYHTDHLGTPRLITDAGRRKLSVEAYLPFGGRAPGGEFAYVGFNDRMRFTGHERDGEGSPYRPTLDYMHARYYTPDSARFLSVDPKKLHEAVGDPQQWNRYAYARNNPVQLIDPDGRDERIGWWYRNFGSVGAHIGKASEAMQRVPVANVSLRPWGERMTFHLGSLEFNVGGDVRIKADVQGNTKLTAQGGLWMTTPVPQLGPIGTVSLPLYSDGNVLPDGAKPTVDGGLGIRTLDSEASGKVTTEQLSTTINATIFGLELGVNYGAFKEAASEAGAAARAAVDEASQAARDAVVCTIGPQC